MKDEKYMRRKTDDNMQMEHAQEKSRDSGKEKRDSRNAHRVETRCPMHWTFEAVSTPRFHMKTGKRKRSDGNNCQPRIIIWSLSDW